MRYLIIALMVLLNVFCAGGVFGAASLFGLAPDIMICFMASLVLMEKSLAGMWAGLASGLLLDILFSKAIGFYAIPYTLCGAVLYFICKRFRFVDNFLIPAAVAVGAFIFRDIITIILSLCLGYNINPMFLFVRFTLPSALETGLLMLAVHLLVRWLYKIRALKTLRYDDMPFKM